MVTVDTVIKDLFKETLSAVQERQEKQDERCNSLESQVKAIEDQLQAKTTEAQQLREELEKIKQDTQGLEGRTKLLEDQDVPALKGQVERLHSDAEGIGGLVQVVQKTDDTFKEVQTMMAQVDVCVRMSQAFKTRIDEFADMVHAFDRRREDLDSFARQTQQRLDVVEVQSRGVAAKQETLETSVATKYERLWQEVLAEIDKIDTAKMNAASASNKGELAAKETKSLVNYALNFVATGFEQRKMQEWSKMLVTAWREQTWYTTRRHIGLRQLHNLVNRRQRRAVQRWQQHAAIGHLQDQIVQECNKKVSSVQAQSHELAKKLDEQTVTWQQRFEEKESIRQVDQKLASHASQVDGKFKAVQDLSASQGKRLDDVCGGLQCLTDKSAVHDKKIAAAQEHSEAIRSELPEFARSTEVQSMLRDLMLVWNLVKQLDVAKGDKKEVDALAVESANSLSRFERKVESIQELFATRLLEEGNRRQEKCSELDGKMEENARQIHQWEKMWEKMDFVMDDVMRKVTMLQQQGVDVSKMPSSTLRRALNRERSRSKKDVPMMVMPPSHGNSVEFFDSRDSSQMQPFNLQAASPIFNAGSLVHGCLDQDATITMRPRAAVNKKKLQLTIACSPPTGGDESDPQALAAAHGASSSVADAILDTLQESIAGIGLALGIAEGQAAARDCSEARTLPALSKVLRRLWFATPLHALEPPEAFELPTDAALLPPPGAAQKEDGAQADKPGPTPEEQVLWLAHLLLISEGSRIGKLSFYGVDAARGALGGHCVEEFRCMSADRLCSARVRPWLSTNMLPATFRRMFDLEGHRLTKAQAAGLGVAMLVPGSGIVTFGGLGAVILVKQVNKHNKGQAGTESSDEDPLQEVYTNCTKAAWTLLQRKTRPLEVTYRLAPGMTAPLRCTPPKVKICVYPQEEGWLRSDVLCAIPAGGFSSEGGGTATLRLGETVRLKPQGKTNEFLLRVFKPALVDVVIHDGVQVKRGSHLVIVPAAGGLVRCHLPPDSQPPPLPPLPVQVSFMNSTPASGNSTSQQASADVDVVAASASLEAASPEDDSCSGVQPSEEVHP